MNLPTLFFKIVRAIYKPSSVFDGHLSRLFVAK